MASVPLNSKARRWLVRFVLDAHSFTAADADEDEAPAPHVETAVVAMAEAPSAETPSTEIAVVVAEGADSNERWVKLLSEMEDMHVKPRDRLSSKIRSFLSKSPEVGHIQIPLEQLHAALFAAKKEFAETCAGLNEDSGWNQLHA